jgi:hypothetical protein
MKPDLSPAPAKPFALVWVRDGIQETKYSITLRTGVVTHTVSFTPQTDADASTDNIAATLVSDINALGGSPYDAEVVSPDSSVLRITRDDSADFVVTIADGRGNTAIKLAKEAVKKFNDIPPQAKNGDVIEVSGDDTDNFEGFYVKWVEADGLWRETIAPGIPFEFRRKLLPHQLVRTAPNTFELSRIDWEDRRVGDEESSPDPSFIGNPINAVFLFKNRLGFTAHESVIMSRPGEFFDFWPKTATEVLDDDPIDISISSNQVSIIRNTLPFNENLLLFTDFQQFSLGSASGALSPLTVSSDPVTRFEVDSRVEPVGSGPNAYFVSPKENSSSIREYFVDVEALNTDAADVTAHVPQFIPPNLVAIEANANLELLLSIDRDARTDVYVYKYFWAGNEKPQSSWSKWVFGLNVVGIQFFESTAYFILEKSGQISLEKLELDHKTTGSLDFRVHLDRQALITGVFALGVTTWTLPFSHAGGQWSVVRPTNGLEVSSLTHPTDTTLAAPGNHSAFQAVVGLLYTKRYQISQWFIRKDEQNPIIKGRLSIKSMTIRYRNTGYFQLEVTPRGRPTVVHKFTGRRIGTVHIGEAGIETGQEKFLVMSDSADTEIAIVNPGYLPSEIQGYNLNGRFTPRTRPL